MLALPVEAGYHAGLGGLTMLAYVIDKEVLVYLNDKVSPFSKLNILPTTFIVKDPPFS